MKVTFYEFTVKGPLKATGKEIILPTQAKILNFYVCYNYKNNENTLLM
jgi:hypothetical protein